ncbi:DUF547 domain-containing protein [Archangium violaceum]|uniref:DUF547 domain-containing protein n=1 Tax=Archangium violaceum TaxID=83451 RepID=UPI00194E28AF|nr:DUF547 domain-containing protein [Archangium violaceum]QRN97034.1 DUF547 domain-containing protein [Archangium violaceum]
METPAPARRRRVVLLVAALLLSSVLMTGGVLHVRGLLPASVPSAETPFSYSGYGQVLRHVRRDGNVDFASVGRERARLDAFVRSLATFSPHSRPDLFPRSEDALAYWLNAYNALVLQAVVDEYPSLRSVEDPWLGSFFWGRSWPVGGQHLTLWALEHRILPREFADPRIHFALFQGRRGGPLLDGAPFAPEFLDSQLNDAVRRFVEDRRHVRLEGNTVYLARVFDTWREDLLAALPEGRGGNVLQFVWAFLPDTCTERPGCDTRGELDRVCGPRLDRCKLVYEPEDGALPDTAAREVRGGP